MLLHAQWVPVLRHSGRRPQQGPSIRRPHCTVLYRARCLRVRCCTAEGVRLRRRRRAGRRLSHRQWRGKVISGAQPDGAFTPPVLVRPMIEAVLADQRLLDRFWRPRQQLIICCGVRLLMQAPLPHAHSLHAPCSFTRMPVAAVYSIAFARCHHSAVARVQVPLLLPHLCIVAGGVGAQRRCGSACSRGYEQPQNARHCSKRDLVHQHNEVAAAGLANFMQT